MFYKDYLLACFLVIFQHVDVRQSINSDMQNQVYAPFTGCPRLKFSLNFFTSLGHL